MSSLLKRLEKVERIAVRDNYEPVVFTKPGESLEKYRIGPKTVVFIDDLESD